MSRVYQRVFLNPDEGTSAAELTIEPGAYYCEAELSLRDCFDTITLQFGFHDEEDYRRSINKLERLRAVIDLLEAALPRAREESKLMQRELDTGQGDDDPATEKGQGDER